MITRQGKPYREFRCSKCRTLLALEYIYSGRFSIKCPNCNTFNDIDLKSAKNVLLKGGSLQQTTFIKTKHKKGGEK